MTSLPLARTAPRASGLPLLGSGLNILRDPYEWWSKTYRELGPVYRLKLPQFWEPWIVIAGRDANEQYHPSFTEGGLQRHLRRQVAPGFSRQAADPHLPAMMSWVRNYVDQWKPGQKFRVTEETARMGLNAISIFTTGKPLGFDSELIREYAITFTAVLAQDWPMWLMNIGQTRRVRDQLDALIAERLAEHAANPPGPGRAPDYFDFLLRGTMLDGSPLPEAAPPPGVRRRSPTKRYSLSAVMLDAIDGAPEVRLSDGQVLFHQGDEPDRLYFILEGKLEVSTDRGTGLHGLPRTATVTAVGPATLLAVDGETFSHAVVESDITARELGELAVRRHAGALIAQVFDRGRKMPRLGIHGHVDELELQAGTTLFRHGEPAEHFYLLASGSLEELAESLVGEPRVLRTITAPDSIGEVGLLDGRPRPTTVRAGRNGAKLLCLDRAAFAKVSHGDASLASLSLVAKIRFDEGNDWEE